jgi:hypothetical protein
MVLYAKPGAVINPEPLISELDPAAGVKVPDELIGAESTELCVIGIASHAALAEIVRVGLAVDATTASIAHLMERAAEVCAKLC